MRDRCCDETVQLGPVLDAAGLEVECGFGEGAGPFDRFGRETEVTDQDLCA